MFSEVMIGNRRWLNHEAEAVGVNARSLRTERMAGRLTYKRVAGKVMYREQRDLARWLNQGEERCQDETEARTSHSARIDNSTTSATPRMDGASGAARALTTADALKRRSRRSSPKDSLEQDGQARVIRRHFPS